MDATTIGIDLAKNVFQIHAADARGKTVFTNRLSRQYFLPFFANLTPCLTLGTADESNTKKLPINLRPEISSWKISMTEALPCTP